MVHEEPSFEFFLGGYDLEMITIRDLLMAEAPKRIHDRQLQWGAKTSDYKSEIDKCLWRGRTPVLIELENDLAIDTARVYVVDHHGPRAGEDAPTALRQVFELLKLPAQRWSRWFQLVAANDRGHIESLVKLGASVEEIRTVRVADRQAQGITEQEEAEAARAIRNRKTLANGRLTIVELSHNKTAPVADLLNPALRGEGYENLLVLSPNEVNFYGDGPLIEAAREAYPGGWYGGNMPERGYWGYPKLLGSIVCFFEKKISCSKN